MLLEADAFRVSEELRPIAWLEIIRRLLDAFGLPIFVVALEARDWATLTRHTTFSMLVSQRIGQSVMSAQLLAFVALRKFGVSHKFVSRLA